MDPAPPEKESYSYDEMMARLRKQRSGSGGGRRVKVASSDGTVEVKHRKRRSHQPKKERQARLGKWKKIAILTAIPLILLIVGLQLLLKVRYQSDGFRTNVSNRFGEVIGARAELAPLTVKRMKAKSRRLVIEPASGQFLRDAEFTNLQGNLTAGSLVSSGWHLTNLSALHGKLRFQPPSMQTAGISLAPARIPLIAAGLGLSAKPENFVVEKMHIGSVDMTWGDLARESVFLQDATLNSTNIGASTDLHITSGKLSLEGWPEFDLDTARLDVSRSKIEIRESLLSHNFIASRGGNASFQGTIDLSSGQQTADINCEFDAMPIESVISKPFVGKLNGDLDSKLNFRADLTRPESLEVSGSFWIREGSFGDVIPTKRLAVFLAEPRISRIQFHSVRGDITIAGGTRTVKNLEATSPDFLKITGGYAISAEGLIDGELTLLLSNKVLEKLPGGKPEFFVPSASSPDMSSTVVKVGGTTTAPTEDLSERVEAALKKYEAESALPRANEYPTLLNPDDKGRPTSDPRKKAAEAAFDKLIEP